MGRHAAARDGAAPPGGPAGPPPTEDEIGDPRAPGRSWVPRELPDGLLVPSQPSADHAVGAGAVVPAVPPRPAFSRDGRFWWDGSRWLRLQPEELVGRRRRTAVGVVLTAVIAVGALGAVTVPTYVAFRGAAAARAALVEAARAQEIVRVELGRYARDPGELEAAGMELPRAVSMEVLPTAPDTYCLAAALPGRPPRWFLAPDGDVTRTPCVA